MHTFQAKLLKKTPSKNSCLFSVCPRNFLTTWQKKKNGKKYSYEILYLDQMSSNLKSKLQNIINILTPKAGFEWFQWVNNGNYKITPSTYTISSSTANSVKRILVEDVISDNFCLKKFP